MYRFPSEMKDLLSRLRGKKILRLCNAAWDDRHNGRFYQSTERKASWFSFEAIRYYLTFGDYGTLAFRSALSGHRSIRIDYLDTFPTREAIERELLDKPAKLVEATDVVYSTSYFADFLNTRVTKIETIHAQETGSARMQRNERGLRITNDKDRQFIIGWNLYDDHLSRSMTFISPDNLIRNPNYLEFEQL